MLNSQLTPRLLKYLSDLIAFESVTPKGLDALEYIAELLAAKNFQIDIQKFGASSGAFVYNLYASYGSGYNVCFAGHVDVVPAGNVHQWSTPPFAMQLIDQRVVGRGAVDMKGAIACMLVAVEDFLAHQSLDSGKISFLLTTDEEGEAKYGLVKMLQYLANKQEQIDFCVLGEPTSRQQIGDTIKIGRRGSINFTLTVKGQQGHVAYPYEADNPITILVKVLHELQQHQFDAGNEFFQPANLEITSIDVGNVTTNVIPHQAIAKFNIRFNTTHSPDSLSQIIHQYIQNYSNNYQLEVSCNSLPFIQKVSDEMQKLCLAVTNSTTTPQFNTSGGTSDARFIHQYAQVAEIGLKHAQAHKINEYTEISDLQKLYKVYYNTLIKFLAP